MSIATVMGPTPPGTGVSMDATALTCTRPVNQRDRGEAAVAR